MCIVTGNTVGNTSHGGSHGGSHSYDPSKWSHYLYEAGATDVDRYTAKQDEMLVLVAAGNDGTNGLGSVGAPGTCKNCLTIGASLAGNAGQLGTFSSRGPTVDGRIKPDVVTIGGKMVSASSVTSESTCETTTMTGTSMACPHVAAAAALVRQCVDPRDDVLDMVLEMTCWT